MLAGALIFIVTRLPEEDAQGVARAIDGDSLIVSGREIRLHGIDAPELAQSCKRKDGAAWRCGREAKRVLARLVAGKQLRCEGLDEDRYGRLVARCLAGKTDINRAMVMRGLAVAYADHSLAYVADEADAKAARRGIWQGTFKRPGDWRQIHRARLTGGED